MSKELKTSEATLPAEMTMDAWGQNEMSAADLVIPKILVMQAMSPSVIEGKASIGDLLETGGETVIANLMKAPLKFIPIHMYKKWLTYRKKKGENKFKFESMEDITALNEAQPWNDTDGKDEIKRVYTRFFYVLTEHSSMPFVLAFKSTSAPAGKQLATQMYSLNALAKKAPPSKTMELFGTVERGDEGSYVVMKVKPVADTPAEKVSEAFEWYKQIMGGSVKVDDSDITEEAQESAATANDIETEY